jgi:hypothetical protein
MSYLKNFNHLMIGAIIIVIIMSIQINIIINKNKNNIILNKKISKLTCLDFD